MSDFKIGKSQQTGEIRFATGRTSDFTRLKTKYRDFKAKTEKTDFANAPVVMQEELDLLVQLKALAKKEKLPSEERWILEREKTVKEQLTTTKINLIANAYYAPVIKTGVAQQQKPDDRLYELLNSCKNDNGLLDPGAEKIFVSLQGKEDCLYHVKNILAKCKNSEAGSVDIDKAEIVSRLANAGVSSARMCEHIDTFTYFDHEEGKDCVDFALLDETIGLMASGLSDLDAVKYAQYLKGNFADKDSVRESLLKLHNAKVETGSVFKIMNALSVVNPDTGEREISQKAVSSVASLKKSLFLTRDNENNERKNQINLLGVSVFKYGDKKMVFKDGILTYSTPVEGENYKVTKERYDQLVASIEDDMLLEFASKYKDKNGEIDNKYLSVASQLRKIGLVYNGLFNVMESCINPNGTINLERLNTIKTIRESGALSDDVPMLVDSCRIDENGKYNQNDVQTVCDLTSYVIAGKEVCSLLDAMRESEDAKDIIMLCLPYFSKNENLIRLIDLMKKPGGEFGENEMEMLYDLATIYFEDESAREKGDDFINVAAQVMTFSRDKDGTVSDDATGICAIMGKAGEAIPTIEEGIINCYGDDNRVDSKLAQILWDMYIQDASLPEVIEMIKVCKTPDGKLDTDKADMIVNLFAAKYSKEKIAELVLPKH